MKLPANKGCFNTTKDKMEYCFSNFLFQYSASILRFSLFIFCLQPASPAAQNNQPPNLQYESFAAGIGTGNVYDSYLSPLQYAGMNITILREKMKMLNWRNGNFSFQRQYLADLSQTLNRTETASNLTLFAESEYAVCYRYSPTGQFQLFAGPQAGFLIGGIYNSRNQNNPISAKVHLNIGFTGIAAYRITLGYQTIRLRYQTNLPAAGILFAPQFGQSYYYLDNNFFASSFGNHLSFKSIFSIELPLNRLTIRAGWINSFYQTKINQLLAQCRSNTFYAGLSKDFYTVKARKKDSKLHHTVFK